MAARPFSPSGEPVMAGATTALVGHASRRWGRLARWCDGHAGPVVGQPRPGRRARPPGSAVGPYAWRSRYHLRQETNLGSQFDRPSRLSGRPASIDNHGGGTVTSTKWARRLDRPRHRGPAQQRDHNEHPDHHGQCRLRRQRYQLGQHCGRVRGAVELPVQPVQRFGRIRLVRPGLRGARLTRTP